MKKTLILSTTLLMVVAVVTDSGEASVIQASAVINLCDPSDFTARTKKSLLPNTAVSTTATCGSDFALARANTDLSVGVISRSVNFGLSSFAGGIAKSDTGFIVRGNPGSIDLPLTFNFGFDGLVSVKTEPGNPASVALASVDYSVNTTQIRGSIFLSSQGGLPVGINRVRLDGAAPNAVIKARLTPKLTIDVDGSKLEGVLTPTTLSFLGLTNINPMLSVDLGEIETQSALLAGSIATAVNTLGIPALNLAGKVVSIVPGAKVDIGFDIEYFVDTQIQHQLNVQQAGIIDILLQSHATTSTANATASIGFGNSFLLKSITLPSDFKLIDHKNLSVEFDSGLTMGVTIVETSAVNSLPEPGSFSIMLLSLAGLGLVVKRRSKP